MTAATNDVGVLTAPDGGRVSIAVFIGDSREGFGQTGGVDGQCGAECHRALQVEEVSLHSAIWHNGDLAARFDSTAYGGDVASLLALDQDGARLVPLAEGSCSISEARRRLAATSPQALFPASKSPEGALSGLWLYFSCCDECHALCQDLETPEGSFWHGILHRQEPDRSNAGYWFRRVGAHPVFPQIHAAAAEILSNYSVPLKLTDHWDAMAFIDFCEEARRKPGSDSEKAGLEIQRAEWQILFDYCARPHQQ